MQALIELPVVKHQQALRCATYAKELKEVCNVNFLLKKVLYAHFSAVFIGLLYVAGS